MKFAIAILGIALAVVVYFLVTIKPVIAPQLPESPDSIVEQKAVTEQPSAPLSQPESVVREKTESRATMLIAGAYCDTLVLDTLVTYQPLVGVDTQLDIVINSANIFAGYLVQQKATRADVHDIQTIADANDDRMKIIVSDIESKMTARCSDKKYDAKRIPFVTGLLVGGVKFYKAIYDPVGQ